MCDFRYLCVSAIAVIVAACGEPAPPDHSPYAGGDAETAQTEPETAQDPVETAEAASDPDAEDGDTALRPTDLLARSVCDALEGEFAALLPENTAFAARGGLGDVHLAWNYQGEIAQHVIHTPSLALDDRLPFDLAVGDFQRHNMDKNDPNRDLTGADRKRDGGFCSIQTEAVAIEALITAYQAVAPLVSDTE